MEIFRLTLFLTLITSIRCWNFGCEETSSSCKVFNISITSEGKEISVGERNTVNIKELQIVNEVVKYFPHNLGGSFPNLQIIDFQGSHLLKIVRDNFQTLKQLNTLNLRDNELTDIERGTFDDLRSLEVLDLTDNQIKTLHRRIFNKLTFLKTLNLESNYIEKIDLNLFKNTRQLKRLSISNNFLKKLPTYAFKNLNQLEELYLDDNDLSSIQNHLFENNKALKKLTVSNNVISSIGEENYEILWNLDEQDFLFNTCTKDLKPDYRIDDLKSVINNFCTVDNETKIIWLNDEITEIKRFKREDEEALECAEFEQKRVNEIIISNVTDILRAHSEKMEIHFKTIESQILADMAAVTASQSNKKSSESSKSNSCQFYQYFFDFMKVSLSFINDEKKAEVFETFAKIQEAIAEKENEVEIKALKSFFTNPTEVSGGITQFKSGIKENCNLNVLESEED